jgi:N-carbamoyl-L-amino-acid hydrolase
LAIVVFADEEGARFGIACAGSRLLTGALDPDKARSLLGRDGLTMHEAMTRVGFDSSHLGVDNDRLSRIGFFVELHVEQGKALVNENAPVGVATTIWPHGRYRFTFTGRADHAGTTAMRDRQDPMTAFAMTAVQTAQLATTKDVRATFGRLEVIPNGTNAIPSQVNAWLDLRTPTQETLDAVLEELRTSAKQNVYLNGTQVEVIPESVTGITIFDEQLRERVRQAIAGSATRESIPAIATGAGHDAGILAAAGIPTAMIFVRNPTGISHSPEEFAEESDAIIGVRALADAVRELMK